MSLGRVCAAGALVAALSGCGPTPAPQPPAPLPRDLVVLVADPASVEVGQLSVSTPAGSVELALAGESTTVTGGQPPGPVTVLSDGEIQQVFGAAWAVIPDAARRFHLILPPGGGRPDHGVARASRRRRRGRARPRGA